MDAPPVARRILPLVAAGHATWVVARVVEIEAGRVYVTEFCGTTARDGPFADGQGRGALVAIGVLLVVGAALMTVAALASRSSRPLVGVANLVIGGVAAAGIAADAAFLEESDRFCTMSGALVGYLTLAAAAAITVLLNARRFGAPRRPGRGAGSRFVSRT
ncbi:MAG: hypothetical protein KDB12_11200 [Ilumatobacter sp.]|nr:hypothetical protein [Ilumatobacter sp.]